MKTMIKKSAAYLLVLLLVFQMVPAFAGTYVSNEIQKESELLELLTIINESGPYILKGQTLQLSLPNGYTKVKWTSSNESVATVDQNGLVTAVEVGKATITVTSGSDKSKTNIEVVAPAEKKEDSGKTSMTILVNGSKIKTPYDGKPHEITYTYSSDSSEFDRSKVVLKGDVASRSIPGAIKGKLTAKDFSYEDDSVDVTFIVNDGSVYITPIEATVRAKDMTISMDELDELDPTATETGVIEGDELNYSFLLPEITGAGEYEIVPYGNEAQGGYSIRFESGKLTVTEKEPMATRDLYNIAEINGKYYRLKKTEIRSDVEIIAANAGKDKLTAEDYEVDDYDFTDLTITIDGKDYIYNCKENAEAIIRGANYYDITAITVSIVMNKIGAMDGNTPRWLVSERYDDVNTTSGFHRDYKLALHVNNRVAEDQRAYTMLSVNGSSDYYKLPTTAITTKPIDELKYGKVNEGEYILEQYDFTNTVLKINDREYKYIDHEPTGDEVYENYFTVSFDYIDKNAQFNRNAAWFAKDESWLDRAREEYGDLPIKTTTIHANYNAKTYDAAVRQRSVTIDSDWPEGKTAYPGARITLTATTVGFDENVRFQWQRSAGEDVWENIPGETGVTYTYTLDDSTAQYSWRVVAED